MIALLLAADEQMGWPEAVTAIAGLVVIGFMMWVFFR